MAARSFVMFVALLATGACSSAGGGGSVEPGAPAAAWTAGRYFLEATVGATLSAQEFTGELTIRAPDDLTLQASSGLCQPPTPADLQRDRAANERTFDCGAARWVVRPIPGGVRGTIRASVEEEYEEQRACPPGQAGPCYIMRTRVVTRNANLRVSPIG